MRGRIRTIKPEAHTDEGLWDLEIRTGFPLFRLFTGLWNYADREGRFEWRPRALKAAILPYWEGDASAALDALAGDGFIVRYEVDGRQFGAVRNFTKHQFINNREDPSVIPGPPQNGTDTRARRVPDACGTPALHPDPRVGHAGKAEGKGSSLGSSLERNLHVHVRARDSNFGANLEPEHDGSTQPDSDPIEVIDSDPTAVQVQTRFRALHMARFRLDPYMGGGESVRTFPERLTSTARARNVDALTLLEQTYGKWRPAKDDKIARSAPYAAFAAHFGSLCGETADAGDGMTEIDRLHAQQADALKSGDRERYRSLVAEENRRNGEAD